MNILIVGNGFDLSHYLPTKYDHFMDVMDAIENHKGKTMSFDDLYSRCREESFIAKTKEFYLTEKILLDKEQLNWIRNSLKENSWYQFFKKHVQDIKTWIDFEQKIHEVLVVTSETCNDILNIRDSIELYRYFETERDNGICISRKSFRILSCFRVLSNEKYHRGISNHDFYAHGSPTKCNSSRINIDPNFCYGKEIKNGFNPSEFLNFIYKELEKFIEIFNLYLDLIVSQLSRRATFDLKSRSWIEPEKIFSFNYTNTYQRIYDSIEVDYLHGSHGEFQNIVLGISDLLNDNLKELKAYGFTKYQQKLFKETDYLFLDSYKEKINLFKSEIKTLEQQAMAPMGEQYLRVLHNQLKERKQSQSLDLNFSIWGHSLDVSDKDYIIDLFSLNDEIDRNVKVTVYYFDLSAKFSLLNNLLAILEKDKVEHWMKNDWLKFKPNPVINFGTQETSTIQEAS